MPHAETRRAARVAAAVAIPSALLAGVGVYALSSGFAAPGTDGPAPGSTGVPVQMAGASLDGRQATVCRALVTKLPDKVRDLNRRPVSRGTEQNAAYGDPALTLACAGAPRP